MNQSEEQAPCGYCCPNCGRDYQSGQRANEALKTMISPDTADVVKRYREEMMDILSKKERELSERLSVAMSSSAAPAGAVAAMALCANSQPQVTPQGWEEYWDGTPAAPGIDLARVQAALKYAEAAARHNTHTELAADFADLIRRIDASPKGEDSIARAFDRAVLEPMRREAKADSPKGSSDAVTALAAFNDVLSPNLRVPNTVTYQIAMLAALQASDTEVRP